VLRVPPLVPRTGQRAPRTGRSWLSDALVRLAPRDPAAAGRLFAELLGMQRLAPGPARRLVYDVTAGNLGSYRVRLDGDGALVQPCPERFPGRPDLLLWGSVAALAPLAAGGLAAPLHGVMTQGSRWGLRRLLASVRRPVILPVLARAGGTLEPRALLCALTAMVEPAWTEGHRYTVAIAVDGTAGGAWTITAGDGGPLQLETFAERSAQRPAHAAIAATPAGLLTWAAGVQPAAGSRPRCTGDLRAVAGLTTLVRRAQDPG
jgi:hypothetical protein